TQVRAAWVLERLDDPPAGAVPEMLSTVQAARWLGHSPKWWRAAADGGYIEGAWQDEDGGPWNLPARSCREYLRRLQQTGIERRGRLRGPRGPRKTAA
ncbi:MAG: hypothetical protein ACRDJ9_30560, partial [Dehalococcoidia bacterium]